VATRTRRRIGRPRVARRHTTGTLPALPSPHPPPISRPDGLPDPPSVWLHRPDQRDFYTPVRVLSGRGATGAQESQLSSAARRPGEIAVARYCARRTERDSRLIGHTAKGRRREMSEVRETSELVTAPAETPDVVEDPEHVIEVATQPLVVISEQQVAFSTAAAVPLPRTKPHRGVFAALRAMFLSSTKEARPEPRHYPPRRDEFLEEAAMAREMRRL